jgi:hypothetical protein
MKEPPLSTITVTDRQPPEFAHTRYVILYTDDAPAFTNIDGLVDHGGDENIAAIVMVASDATSTPVTIEKEDGVWTVRADADHGDPEIILEAVEYGDNDEQLNRDVYVPGFLDESVPYFTEMSMRNR